MRGIDQEQNKIVYRLCSKRKEHNPFSFPIYRLDLDYCPGRGTLLYATFTVDHIYKNELGQFIRSAAGSLEKLGFTVGSNLYLSSDDAATAELQTCHLKYVGKVDLGNSQAAAQLMRHVAARLGTPSMPDFSIKWAEKARSPHRLSLALQSVM